MFEEAGRYGWQEVPEPEITAPEQALVRPLVVACCDLDVAVAHGYAPLPPGYAVGHEGLFEVVAVGDGVRGVRPGDRVVVPFQISCGDCRECRRGATGSCGSVPLMAMYGLGPLAGLNGGGFMSDLVLVPYADAMLIGVPDGVDGVSIASLSDNIPDGWRAIGPFSEELAQLDAGRSPRPGGGPALDRPVRGGLCRRVGSPRRLRRHRRAAPGGRRTAGCDRARSGEAGQVVGSVSGDCAHVGQPVVAGRHAAGDLARRGVYRHRDLLPTLGRDAVAADVHPRRAVRHRPGQCAGRDSAGPGTAAPDATYRRPSTASSPGRTPRRCGRR